MFIAKQESTVRQALLMKNQGTEMGMGGLDPWMHFQSLHRYNLRETDSVCLLQENFLCLCNLFHFILSKVKEEANTS